MRGGVAAVRNGTEWHGMARNGTEWTEWNGMVVNRNLFEIWYPRVLVPAME